MKRLSDGEVAELRAQFIDLLDRSWTQHSTAGHAESAVFARKPDGSWRICHDYRGLNTITRPAVEPLPHIDALLDGTRGSRFFTKSSIWLAVITAAGATRGPLEAELSVAAGPVRVVPFGLQGPPPC